VEALLALEPEELAGVLMEHLQSLPENETRRINWYNALYDPSQMFLEYPAEKRQEIRYAVLEAWMWLEREGMFVPRADEASRNFYRFSRRGKRMKSRSDISAYRGQQVLRREQLHPRIAADVWALFVRGKYDTAVFEAFEEVEVFVET